jgi:CubicO group peptidase (beta-lactamase class C family)
MLLRGGELDGQRVLGRKTIELMTKNHLPAGGDLTSVALGAFGETQFDGVGFGLGFAVSLGEAQTQQIGADGDYYWGGAASTVFWNDPREDLTVIFMTQLMPSSTFNFRGQLRNLVYSAIED